MLEFCAKMCKQRQTFLCSPSPTNHVEDTGKKEYWSFGNYWSQNGDITENTISTRFRRNRICLNFAPKCANNVRLFCVRPVQLIMWKTLARKKIEVSAIIDLKMAISRKMQFQHDLGEIGYAWILCQNVQTKSDFFVSTKSNWSCWRHWQENKIEISAIIDLKMEISRKKQFQHDLGEIGYAWILRQNVQTTSDFFVSAQSNLIMWKTLARKKDWSFGNYWSQNGDITENAISTRFGRNRICLNFAPKCENKVRRFCVHPVQLIMWKTLARKKDWNFGNYWSQNGDITENAISTRLRRNRICLNFVPKCENKVRLFCVCT